MRLNQRLYEMATAENEELNDLLQLIGCDKDDWRQKHTRTSAHNKVVTRYQKQERKAEDCHEQKESDNRSQRSTKN